jgi:hypothetical protein
MEADAGQEAGQEDHLNGWLRLPFTSPIKTFAH